MDVSIINTDVNRYWNVLKDLSSEVKLELIARLSNSLLAKKELFDKEKSKPLSASRFYGVWKDCDFEDADSLNKEIKDSRRFKDDIEAF